MDRALAIRTRSLSKRYQVVAARVPYRTLRDVLVDRLKRVLRWEGRSPADPEASIWALRGVSLDFDRGEVVGVIGRNGSGKSTLLKVLSRITAPTEGQVELWGRTASLLEVGTGFHLELTGRENVYLSGAILGMSRKEIRSRFDEIVAFSGLERFIDTPVKHYSSGMQSRLGFAVAAHLQPEILLVDEVLAVGDAEFQARCVRRMQDIGRGGRTVLFVSHDLGAVSRLCQRVVWLDAGQVRRDGLPAQVIGEYLASVGSHGSNWTRGVAPRPAAEAWIASVRALTPARTELPIIPFDSGVVLEVCYEIARPVAQLALEIWVTAALGEVVFTSWDTDGTPRPMRDRTAGRFKARCLVPGHFLRPGTYSVSCWLVVAGLGGLERHDAVVTFQVGQQGYNGPANRGGLTFPLLSWETDVL